jgi:uncharacterized protein (TIGR02466 family)
MMIISPLFPTPVACVTLDKPFTKTEKNFIEGLEKKQNTLNRFSKINYILNEKPLQKLKTTLEAKTNQYFNSVYKPNNDVKIVITQSWVNYTIKGEAHHAHIHPNSFVSGVLYIKTNGNQDQIRFHNPIISSIHIAPVQWDIFNSKIWSMNVSEGELFLFPSGLMHDVPTVTGDVERISLSFNTFLVGKIGNNEFLTELIIGG